MENKEGSKSTDAKGQSGHVGQQLQRQTSSNKNLNTNGGSKQHGKNANQGKAGRPCREIYRPPSLRTKSSRNSIGGKPTDHISTTSNYGNTQTQTQNTAKDGGKNEGGKSVQEKNENPSNNSKFQANGGPNGATSGGCSSVPNSPLITRHVFNFNPQQQNQQQSLNKSLNINAKEFQLTPSQQQQIQNQQLVNLLSQLDPKFYNDAAGAILASSAAVFSLQQSKSLGNNLNLFVQQQIQANSSRMQHNGNIGFGPFVNPPNGNGLNFNNFNYQNAQQLQQQFQQQNVNSFGGGRQDGQFNPLSQSKSSGSIPAIAIAPKPRVRFDDEDSDEEASRNTLRNAETSFASMNLNGDTLQTRNLQQGAPKSPIMPPKQLQKSRTGFLLNMYAQPTSPPTQMSNPVYQNQTQSQNQGILKQQGQGQPFKTQLQSPQPTVKRSRSFGSGSFVSQSQLSQQSQRTSGGLFSSPVHSVYSDFQISKWPKRVQETVTAAVTAVERVAARTQIEMVNLIFEAMLNSSVTLSTSENGMDKMNGSWRDNETDEESADLSSAAVHIFLYFIQREKDRTVMESLMNTCFATFQKLFGSCQQVVKDVNLLTSQCCIFLKFLSALYSQVKLIRRQNSRQQGHQTMDEMSFTLLALNCDSCLATLRSRLSNEPLLMGCLFTVMTCQGRDMETTFPLKMKQLLAAVRDTLLGLGPYSKGPLSSMVQKTLMQLIELHAANWALPASAVRYYYSSTNSAGNSNNLSHKSNNSVGNS